MKEKKRTAAEIWNKAYKINNGINIKKKANQFKSDLSFSNR